MPTVEDKAGAEDPFANFNNDFGALGLGDKSEAPAIQKESAGTFDFGEEDPGVGPGNDIFGNFGGAPTNNNTVVQNQPPAQQNPG